jgi:hypothetical protein
MLARVSDTLPDSWRGLASDPTLTPDLTVRPSDAPVTATRRLPELSIDLRPHDAPPAVRKEGADLELEGVIGEGGMGRVLLARQHSLSRDVAVKTARPDASAATRAALLDEGVITGQLEHPAIVPVHALGVDPSGWPAMVMKRVEGVTWDALAADPAHPGWEGWEGDAQDRLAGHLQILTQVCNALHFAHSRGFVHRDVKPANVLIGRFGDVYVADWGVAAKVGTVTQQLCGTPAYLAPEMVNAGPVDARTDVYLLGATLHAVLTGQPRHEGSSVTEALLHAKASPPAEYGAQVPRELGALCNRACHLDPAERPQSAKAFRDELSRYVRHRDARALADQAIARLAELEQLVGEPSLEAAQQRRVDRLLLEAHFGLEQALRQFPENAPARDALARLEAIFEQRRQRALAFEREARERDPLVGAAWRTVSLAIATLITAAAAVAARGAPSAPSPLALFLFPAVVVVLFGIGAFRLRHRILHTRFNRQMFGCMTTSLGFMMAGRALGLAFDIPVHEHMARDSFVAAAVMTVCAIALMPWTALVAAVFLAAGVACVAVPEHALTTYSAATVVAMVLATTASWLMARAAQQRIECEVSGAPATS